ncbi:MAG TPA: CheR family methyltransferase [Polyangiaceae bacterium]|jgi:chemotaxis protein methyltransferase CheR
MSLRSEDVRAFRSLVGKHIGLDFDDSKLDYLSDVLSERLKAHDTTALGSYVDRLGNGNREELRALAEQLTVTETYFFRYWDHFRAFSELVLPKLLRARRGTGKIRILSAGCASGEEAYSLAMLAREHVADLESIEILGVDINPAMIQKALRGRYSPWALRTTSPAYAERYFQAGKGTFTLLPTVVQAATFEEGNLVDASSSFWQARYDLVFCRNALMYFAPEVAAEVVKRIARCLNPDGYLFLGHAETLRGLSTDFHLCHTHDTFYYSLRGDAERGAAEGHRTLPPVSAPTPALAETDSSWVELIRGASDRIASLTTPTQSRPAYLTSSAAPRADARSALARAVGMLEEERFAEALAVLHALPTSARKDPEALLLRAVVLTNSGELAEAECACSELLELDELNAGAHYLSALCREHAGDYAAALDHDRTAAYLEDGFAMPHVHMGLLAVRIGRNEDALSAFGKALRLLAREDASRILLFGGGFRREALLELCRSKLAQLGAPP